MNDLNTTYHTRVRGTHPALDRWADSSGRAMHAADARLGRGDDPREVARTGYRAFGLGSTNLDHVLVDLRGRRDGAVASAKLARDALVERIARAGKRVDKRVKALAKADAARANAEAAVASLRAKLVAAVARAGKGAAAIRERAAARCDALGVGIAAKAADLARLGAEIPTVRFAVHQGKRHAANLGHRIVEAERRVTSPRLCFGSRELFRERHDLEAHDHANHAAWLAAWRHARSDDVFVIGEARFPSGNGFVRATPREDGALDLEVRLPPAAAGQATRSIHLRRVNPAFTSIIGRVVIASRLGLSVHAGAAVAVGRRAMGFSERFPRVAEVVVDLGRLGHVPRPTRADGAQARVVGMEPVRRSDESRARGAGAGGPRGPVGRREGRGASPGPGGGGTGRVTAPRRHGGYEPRASQPTVVTGEVGHQARRSHEMVDNHRMTNNRLTDP